MPTYADLEPGSYYLIVADNESDTELVTLLMQTETSVLLRSFIPEMVDFFAQKTDTIDRIVETLTDEMIQEFHGLYANTEEEVFEEELLSVGDDDSTDEDEEE